MVLNRRREFSAACGLFQKNDRGKHRDGQREHQPLKIVAPEPAGEMQNQDDDCDGIKSIEHGLLPDVIFLARVNRMRKLSYMIPARKTKSDARARRVAASAGSEAMDGRPARRHVRNGDDILRNRLSFAGP